MNSIPSNPEGVPVTSGGGGNPHQVSAAVLRHLRLYSPVRRGGGGRRARSTLVTETTTMIVIGILFGVVGIGFLCWLLFSLAVYALPFFAAVSAGLWAYHGDARAARGHLCRHSGRRCRPWSPASTSLHSHDPPGSGLQSRCCSRRRRRLPATTPRSASRS